MGWVQKNRNKGGLVFVDVRDRSGIIQVVFEEGKCEAALIEKGQQSCVRISCSNRGNGCKTFRCSE